MQRFAQGSQITNDNLRHMYKFVRFAMAIGDSFSPGVSDFGFGDFKIFWLRGQKGPCWRLDV